MHFLPRRRPRSLSATLARERHDSAVDAALRSRDSRNPHFPLGGATISSRLLISGATGMIGSLLTEALVARGVEFSVMLRPGDAGDRIAGKPGVTATEGDFDDSASLRRALQGVDRAFLLTNSSERVEAQQVAFV